MPIYKDVSSLELVTYTVPEDGTFADGVSFILEKLDDFPTADVEPVRHGHWAKNRDGVRCICSVCKIEYTKSSLFNVSINFANRPDYCPGCGAKMDEEVEE